MSPRDAGDATGAAGGDQLLLRRAMPLVFVVIWSTGFVVARYGMPHAPPLSFLTLRFVLSIACLGLWIAVARAAWPRSPAQWAHLAVSGVLMHAGYLGGVWAAVKHGIGAGTVALIVGLQPLLTAVWVTARGSEQAVRWRQWFGLGLGLAGVLLVVWHKLGAGEVHPHNLALALAALLSITAGTLYQKRHVRACDVRTANTVQLLGALLVAAPLAGLEHEPVVWHPDMVMALAWSVLVLTLGGSSLLMLLIQRGAATQVASLLYLVPPCTAVLAWWLFGERLTPLALLGTALTVVGVSWVVRTPARHRPAAEPPAA